ncbi:MAG: multi-sensor signal transduction histidine [Geobacteraceae bacterium]|nr:MAG: multi-sensor signal transduction histidine [Geobacteraceae bacterium]
MREGKTAPLKIAAAYMLIGGAWILLSDRLVAMMVRDPETITHISVLKGWFFIFVTAGLLNWFVHRNMSALWRSEEALMRKNEELITAEEVLRQKIDVYGKTQLALQESEERYRLLFENNPHPMWVYDLETLAFLAVNNAAVQHYGYLREEFLTMTLKDIRPKEDVPALLDNVAHVTFGLDSAGIWRHRKKDGSLIHVEVTSHTLNFGTRPSEVVLANDVTERVRAEEEVRRLTAELEERVKDRTAQLEAVNEELQTIFSAFPDLFFRLDHEGVILDYKARALADLFAPPLEFLGKRMQEALPPEAGGKFYEMLQRLWETKELTAFEYSLPMPQGKEFFEARLLPIFENQIIAIVRNITERKRADEKIKKLNDDLQRRAFELESANKELESFSYAVSHDLRAPLRHIEGFSKALMEDCGNQLDDQGKMYVQRLKTATQRMVGLIDDMLKLANVTSCELIRQPVNLSRMAHIIALEYKQTQPERRVVFNIAEDVTAHGDARLLRVVLANLLGNAWKYTGKQEETVIEFGTIRVDGEAAYFVRDNGAGFDMAYAEKLFGAFQRLHSTEEFEGTGIGLATVQRVIRRHGGRVWAEGEVGRGATFYFTLGPVVDNTEK